MAGQPRKRAVIDELERRAVHDGCTVLEYAVDWLEGGGTLFSLARSIQRRLWPDELKDKRHPPAGIVEKHLKSLTTAEGETGAQVLSRARSSGSARGIEEALEIADDATEDDVQVARLRVGHRQWIAERLAPEFKQQKGTNVHISIGALHLDALRQRASAVATLAPSESALDNRAIPEQIEDAQVVDAQGDSSA